MYHRVEEHPDLLKDEHSGAVANTNESALRAAKLLKKRAVDDTTRINKLEEELGEIKSLLVQLIKRET